MVQGRNRSNPLKPGGKYSVSLPKEFEQEFINKIEEKVKEKGSLNAAFLYFIEMGIRNDRNIEGESEIKIPFSEMISEKGKADIIRWLKDPMSTRTIEFLILYLNGNSINLFSENMSEKNNLISEKNSEINPNKYAQKLLQTGFYGK